MERSEFIRQLDRQEKLVRTEAGYTQQQMALLLGLSKKTLVVIEKGRASLGWTGAVTLCTLFAGSAVLQNAYGGELSDMLRALAFAGAPHPPQPTMGGHVWWRTVRAENGWRIQQNIISQHYRILDAGDGRLFSSFSLEEIEDFWAMYGPAKS